jgi:hypothetical protein
MAFLASVGGIAHSFSSEIHFGASSQAGGQGIDIFCFFVLSTCLQQLE